MIFPDIRISDLEKTVETRRRALEDSQELFSMTLHQKARPLAFATEHPKIIFTTLFTGFSAFRFLFNLKNIITGKGRSSIFWKLFKAGWMLKLAKAGASFLIKSQKKRETSGLPFLIQSVLKLLKI